MTDLFVKFLDLLSYLLQHFPPYVIIVIAITGVFSLLYRLMGVYKK